MEAGSSTRRASFAATTTSHCSTSVKKPEVKTPDRFIHPLTDRYASEEMSAIFSARFKFETWRRLWLWLAEEERRLGLPISEEALTQMRAALAQIDFEAAEREGEEWRHGGSAHVGGFR